MSAAATPVRVLHAVDAMDHGGIEHLLIGLYRAIDRSKVQFDFVYREERRCIFDDEIESLGGRIFRFQSPDRHPAASYRFFSELFRSHPEWGILHEHRSMLLGFMTCMRAARDCGVPVRILHSHNERHPTHHTGAAAVVAELSHRVNARMVDALCTDMMACSQPASEWLFARSACYPDGVAIVPNAIDAEAFRYERARREATRAELDIPADAMVVGNVGRLTSQKNQAFLVDILEELSAQGDWRLLMVGEGEAAADIERRLSSKGLRDRAVLAGPRDDCNVLYSAMDALCMPSLFEGLPVSAVEAQASGLPCLFSEAVTQEASLGGQTCFMPLAAGASAWAERIRAMVERAHDRGSGVEAVCDAGFDISGVAAWLRDFYLGAYGKTAR